MVSVNNANSIGSLSSLPQVAGSSPFAPHIVGLAKKYAPQFNLDEGSMTAALAAILENETGNQASFVPSSVKQVDSTTGDHGHGRTAWQIDDRHHTIQEMTFEQAGEYAIEQVLLPGYQLAVEKGLSDPIVAAARFYNGGNKALNDDTKTTKKYGERFATAFNKYAGIYGGRTLPNVAVASSFGGSNSSSNLAPSPLDTISFEQPNIGGGNGPNTNLSQPAFATA